jgi:coenzyme F420 biosynthesis associated uncharacterized protein
MIEKVPQQERPELFRRAVAAAALGVAAAISARAFFRSGSSTDQRKLVDWDAVRRVAIQRSGEHEGAPPLKDAARLSAEYDAIAHELAPLLAEVCGVIPTDFPRFVALDRRGFIDANLIIVRRLLDPVEQMRANLPGSRATHTAQRLIDRYIGELFGLMARRVLGQYDPVLLLSPVAEGTLDAPSLYLVEPNIEAFEREHSLPGASLRRWLILHELTHAWQFQAHPWLGEYITSQMREMLMSGIATADGSLLHNREVLQRLPETVRAQLRGVSRLQAVMSVLEGYSNFVMHRVGRHHIEHADQLEAAAHRRRSERSVLERLVMALTGLEMKMRQYEIGEKFATVVTDRAGLATLNRVWDGPESLPTMDELRYPSRWLARMR